RHTRSDRDWSSDVCSSDLRSMSAQDFLCKAPLTERNWPRQSPGTCKVPLGKSIVGGIRRKFSLLLTRAVRRPARLCAVDGPRWRSEERRVGRVGGWWWVDE